MARKVRKGDIQDSVIGNGPPSPFAEKWIGAELCNMMKGTRSSLPSAPRCEDSAKVFV